MKRFSSELAHNYKKYSFGYANYCLHEKGDKLSEIYASGYLPYSGSPDVKKVFYEARSARVSLKNFVLTSENRRIANKFDGKFKRISKSIKDFDIDNKSFLSFCVDYFSKRHGPSIMPPDRLTSILKSGVISDIVMYEKEGKPSAYYFECSDEKMSHFWYSFYDLNLIHQSLGMWLMIDSARQAKERGVEHLYIGTVYGEKALYKTAFKNLEYWDGQKWTADVKKLKEIARSEKERSVDFIDEWKKELKLF
ncbi:MAG: hypothetical protein A3B91_02640 [Candidatus Yanofskybacteria bacterium RIFCSPHIGHO2_02_FULL_41_29]|uniref:BioF2-like acetyltransferase domain-containing protein n=1 Tax=Candidatus Yanofskybacteria bacterium RIFCSPHIGHO2_01_FULL_41_53 TaxID=1802663 RepID=A0A1F8EM74_9BACT|nr:MAG: hypothetical protein A3I27_01430 [Candidatus Giovannonibacteria bacterium RIFCSPLOWO2_02_FULL_43_11b]OGN01944.1 MAG: hypothetical protein A2650_00080 [Candidatus Yanofskybacteria bacterium RIFCSPHIGHO2_01_FULL_41_53]OGN12037.1 MAG: hypothetical protein A3B91_02640 [Candidatus Yanofskybacteria bacterium RIFCSPHIGHO2_02_FULL_41_29]OGN21283.1 MAG: hypothetical protein A2916_00600 [Candidatus Yanofskybacteria bacterium RIFCSPLOWO2_01_FULL_41_67]OGN35912.1 MAG: hypothetical protein A3F98_012